MKKFCCSVFITFTICINISSCNNKSYIEGDPISRGVSSKAGTLVLSLEMSQTGFSKHSNPKIMLPGISMEPVNYTVLGSGPAGTSFNITSDEDTIVIDDLAFGEWTIQVTAYNNAGTIIADGTGVITVSAAETAFLEITVTPLKGTGTLNLLVEWPAGSLDIPSIESQLRATSGDVTDLDFTIANGTNQSSISNYTIEAGYHTIIVKLFDNGELYVGAVDVVRIVKDEITDGTIVFSEVKSINGNINLDLSFDMQDPIDVVLNGTKDTLYADDTMTVEAVPQNAENVIYQWFIDGNESGTGQSIILEDNLDEGIYRLDVVVFTVDGTRGGSAGHIFHVKKDLPKMTREIIWSPGPDSILLTEDDVIDGYANIETGTAYDTLIFYSDAGPDGEFLTNDDIPEDYYARFIYLPNDEIGILQFNDPGPDGIWYNDDDVIDLEGNNLQISSYYTNGVFYSPIYEKYRSITGPGLDGQYFTSDDDLEIYLWAEKDINGYPSNQWLSNGIGADNIWGTTDDNILRFYGLTVDADGFVIAMADCINPGDDNDWTTIMDNQVYRYHIFEYSNNNMITDIIIDNAGADGLFGTDDDVIDEYIKYTYDSNGSLMSVTFYVQDGDDNTWFTEDDGADTHRTYEYK